jgi:hypothetical protein
MTSGRSYGNDAARSTRGSARPRCAGSCSPCLLLRLVVVAVVLTGVSAEGHTPQRVPDAVPDVRVRELSSRVRDYPNSFDLGDPIQAFVSLQYLKSQGRAGRYRSVASYRTRGFYPPSGAPDEAMTAEKRDTILETPIRAVLSYGENVAAVLTPFQESMFLITYLTRERGEWRHAGEDLGNDFTHACAVFRSKAENFSRFVARIEQLRSETMTEAQVVAYLQMHSQPADGLILEALAVHRLVIYGEVHRRRASWDLLRKVVSLPEFTERVGTVFLELSADAQPALDAFFENDRPAPDALWSVFQDIQIDGWYDRGLFEFLEELRARQRRLAPSRRVRIVAVDQTRPFGRLRTAAEMERHFNTGPDRNTQMATRILESLRKKRDGRASLFVVGVGHAFKSRVPGFAVGRHDPKPSAAAQLVQVLGAGNVFTIFQHAPIISNDGTVHGLVRHGLLDGAFRRVGNTPVAFRIAGSPLAHEPFDGLFEITYAREVGDWATNYDAYLFLGPLETEAPEYLFSDFLTDAFVVELKRRAALVGSTVERWFGVEAATKVAIVQSIARRSKANSRWPNLQDTK